MVQGSGFDVPKVFYKNVKGGFWLGNDSVFTFAEVRLSSLYGWMGKTTFYHEEEANKHTSELASF